MNILNNFEIDGDFWSINPSLKIPKLYAELYDKDRSEGRRFSGRVMWAIALLVDPQSKFANLPYADRKKLILEDFVKYKRFKWEDYKECIAYYENMLLTPAQRQVNIWKRKMDEKTEYLDSLSYEEDSETIEKLLISNAKLYVELERISKQLEKEESDGYTKGGAEESMTEKGLI